MAAILRSLLLTVTCDQDTPDGITPVATTTAPVAEGEVTPLIHQALQGKESLPAKHMADTAFVDAELLVRTRQEYGVDLIGPTRPDYTWQAKAATGGSQRAPSPSTGRGSRRSVRRALPA
jgi:transposase